MKIYKLLPVVTAAALLVTFTFLPKPEVPVSLEVTEQSVERDVFLPVVMYHNVTKDGSRIGEYTISVGQFESDMNYLLRNGYTTVSAADVISYVERGTVLPAHPVLVTFDDGQSGVLHYLKPVIERLGVKVTLNIEGAYTDRDSAATERSSEYSNLTWTELRELGTHSLYELGNHTYDMHRSEGRRLGCKRRPGESLDDYKTALNSDIGKLQLIFAERCSVTPNVFAYPFGFVSDESVTILSDMGFKVLLTCYEKPNYVNATSEFPLILHRYNRSGNVSTETYMSRLLRGK